MAQARNTITSQSRVTLHFSISLADGTEVVSTFDEAPLSCTIGDGTMVEGLEQCLLGLSTGHEELFILSGAETFGPATAENMQRIAKNEFPAEMSLAPGQVIAFKTPGGDELAGIVQTLTDTEVLVDFNHPLSAQPIAFMVKILDVANTTT
jgi:FKBP-type peptidyl-prolyl cis-trans isomerase SlpA